MLAESSLSQTLMWPGFLVSIRLLILLLPLLIVPDIALSIPDFEGQAILRIFANSTQSEVACYSAVVTNGATFSHPSAVGTVLGTSAIVAIVASFATAVFGDNVILMRKHHAHSMSVLVVFAAFQHIFFTGALSVNWPSVLVAFWSNYAWTGGMIYASSMQQSITNFVGLSGNSNGSNAATSSIYNSSNFGGGLEISSVYGHALNRRDSANIIGVNYTWYGNHVGQGLPLPGNFTGFAGTLAQENIPLVNAFMTGFLWILILLLIVGIGVPAMKWALEGLVKMRWIEADRLPIFRQHWLRYTGAALARTIQIAFFSLIFLACLEFAIAAPSGVTALSAIIFATILLVALAVAGFALYTGMYHSPKLQISLIGKAVVIKAMSWPQNKLTRTTITTEEADDESKLAEMPLCESNHINHPSWSIHDDEEYIMCFGWLAARCRQSTWWFFALWLIYELTRACFYGGAVEHPLTQVFGLLTIEVVAFVAMIILKPFEGQRLNMVAVYALGFSKVTTTALSAAFCTQFNLTRITTTICGIVIIVIQGLLTVVVLVSIVLGAFSSYISITRNEDSFRPQFLTPIREKCLRHIEQIPGEDDAEREKFSGPSEKLHEPYFKVDDVRRLDVIGDDDEEYPSECVDEFAPQSSDPNNSNRRGNGNKPSWHSRHASSRSKLSYSNLPFGARRHRASWSTADFAYLSLADGTDSPLDSTRGRTANRMSYGLPVGTEESEEPNAFTTTTSVSRLEVGEIIPSIEDASVPTVGISIIGSAPPRVSYTSRVIEEDANEFQLPSLRRPRDLPLGDEIFSAVPLDRRPTMYRYSNNTRRQSGYFEPSEAVVHEEDPTRGLVELDSRELLLPTPPHRNPTRLRVYRHCRNFATDNSMAPPRRASSSYSFDL